MHVLLAISRHGAHTPHGVGVGPFTQLSILATMRAVEVLPVPRAPQNSSACGTRFISMALHKARAMCSWPTSSDSMAGRYLRARTRYAILNPQTRSSTRNTKGPENRGLLLIHVQGWRHTA